MAGEPVLFALNTDGSLRGSVRLQDVVNRDWEDVAAFTLDGQAWLMAAETSDNFARHAQSALHVIAEPDAGQLDPACSRPTRSILSTKTGPAIAKPWPSTRGNAPFIC